MKAQIERLQKDLQSVYEKMKKDVEHISNAQDKLAEAQRVRDTKAYSLQTSGKIDGKNAEIRKAQLAEALTPENKAVDKAADWLASMKYNQSLTQLNLDKHRDMLRTYEVLARIVGE